jgi:hypothetical protein
MMKIMESGEEDLEEFYDYDLDHEIDEEVNYDESHYLRDTYTPKLPFIEFKDHVDEQEDNHRFLIYFSLIFAIIGAIIVVAIPVDLLFPSYPGIGDPDISSKLPLLQSVAGAVLGAFLGSAVGFILDLWVNVYRVNKKTENEEINPQ